jgi:hypothetical protein
MELSGQLHTTTKLMKMVRVDKALCGKWYARTELISHQNICITAVYLWEEYIPINQKWEGKPFKSTCHMI